MALTIHKGYGILEQTIQVREEPGTVTVSKQESRRCR